MLMLFRHLEARRNSLPKVCGKSPISSWKWGFLVGLASGLSLTLIALFYIFTSDEVDSRLNEIRANHVSAIYRSVYLYLIYQLHRVE